MVDEDVALAEALAHHNPAWSAPDESAWMRRQRAELVDIEPLGVDEDDDE